MDLTLYRRHLPTCKHRDKGQNFTKCSCPIWCDGKLNGRRIRKSTGLRDWARAVRRVEKWEESPKAIGAGHSLGDAIARYIEDCRSRNLAASTIVSYSKTLAHLSAFCESLGITAMDGVDLDVLTDFRSSRSIAASTQAKEIEALRSFFAFSLKRKWVAENYAQSVNMPLRDIAPTMPFEQEEIERILAACDAFADRGGSVEHQERARKRIRALILVLLYSGLRISDAIKLERSSVDFRTGKLLLRVMKTGVPLYLTLQPVVIDALKRIQSGRHFFWSGDGKLSTCIGNARQSIDSLMKRAGVEGHPHRFRDTFAVRLLLAGEELRTVQLLLGHTSIKTTEKHYAPYVASFQRILDSATAKLDFVSPASLPVGGKHDGLRDTKSNVVPLRSTSRTA